MTNAYLKCIAGSFFVYLVLTLSGLVSIPVYAQVAGANLTGTVTDASGSGVPKASVSIKNTNVIEPEKSSLE